MKYLLFVSSMIFFVNLCFSQKTDKKLIKEVTNLVTGFNGEIGIYVKNLKNFNFVDCSNYFFNRLMCGDFVATID